MEVNGCTLLTAGKAKNLIPDKIVPLFHEPS